MMRRPPLTFVRCVSALLYLALAVIGIGAAALAYGGGFRRGTLYICAAAACMAAFPATLAAYRWKSGGRLLPIATAPDRPHLRVLVNAVGLIAVLSMILSLVMLDWPITPDQTRAVKLGVFGYLGTWFSALANELL